MRVAVTGASGRIGRYTVAALEGSGHQTVPVGRSVGVDAYTGTGLDEALAGVDVVIDVSNTPSQNEAEIVDFFGTVTGNLLPPRSGRGWGITCCCRSSASTTVSACRTTPGSGSRSAG